MDVVLVGGLWLDGSAWERVVPALAARGHRPVPVTLPGQGDGDGTATLDDQLAAVLAAVDAAPGPVLVAGHSAACGLAWLAADRRPGRVARVALIGGVPVADGKTYADFFEVRDGAMPFPGWEPFAGPESDDLGEEGRRALEAAAVPVPEGVARGTVRLTDPRRYDVPVLLVCAEISPEQARAWIAAGEAPELPLARHLSYADIDSGHWPMFTRPEALAHILADAADETEAAKGADGADATG
ncbi:alpha/beta fold hydrolase [Streptomyces sp. SPB074]|uniref:alpha/beta fold hydrolase n=1 Tax=Streptomyces sp. (strain SPB074) TaxID=465543 RepID=UPI00017F1EAE|nr:alpha/beta hydrolase [Streptomyces sp. SPB074]EDY44154.1 esterase [Streptomyces sp. SPB074]